MPKEHNWNPSFSKDIEWPYGGKLVFEHLDHIFVKEEPLVINETYYESFKDTSFTDHNLIIINTEFEPDSLDLDQLYRFVNEGNQVFIVSENLNHWFLDSLGIEMDYVFNTGFSNLSGVNEATIKLNFINKDMRADSSFQFKETRYYNHFNLLDSAKTIYKIGTIGDEKIGFIRIPYGNGNFFLHSYPYAFTNYNLLKEDLTDYVSLCFSQLPKQKVIWDEYYKITRQMAKTTPLYVLLKSKSFKWAYWLSLTTILLFIVFYAKRKQRIIPVIPHYKNESLNFTKTISALYFQKRDNRDLALKKINYFREYINSTYHVKGLKFNEEEAMALSHKSIYELDYIQRLFRQIRNIKSNSRTSDSELKVLTEKMNHIYNRKKIYT